MKKLIHMCATLLCALLPMGAQEYYAPYSTEGRTDSLFVVDEDALVAQLIGLVKARQGQASEPTTSLSSTMELLRLQLLFDLFAPRPQMVVAAPAAAPSVVSPTIHLQHPGQDYEARLARIEMLLMQLLRGQQTSVTTLPVTQRIEAAQPSSPVSITLPEQRGISDERLDALERRLDALRAQQQIPLVQESSPSVTLLPIAPMPAEVITDTVHIKTTEVVLAPVDFHRSVYFGVGAYSLDSNARTTLQEVAGFLYQYPETKVRISGFASPDGNAAYNAQLAERRRSAVEQYLEAEGVARSRFVSEGAEVDHGASSADLARRVDISLLR